MDPRTKSKGDGGIGETERSLKYRLLGAFRRKFRMPAKNAAFFRMATQRNKTRRLRWLIQHNILLIHNYYQPEVHVFRTFGLALARRNKPSRRNIFELDQMSTKWMTNAIQIYRIVASYQS
jgi:hypothetical protein